MLRMIKWKVACIVGLGFGNLLASDSCTFRYRPSAIGDTTHQKLICDLDLEMAIKQGEQIVESKHQVIQRTQQRKIQIISTGEKIPKKALVSYQVSKIALQQGKNGKHESSQPVAGKSYYVIREGNGPLQVTDLQGNTPPEAEATMVKSNLEAFGLPNPIARFFQGKTIRVGQTVQLPLEIAKELLGFQDTVGDVQGLTLKLHSIRKVGNSEAAVFDTKLVADNKKNSGVQLELQGQIAIEVATCRTMAVNLGGPVSVEENYGPAQGRFSVTSDGKINVAVRATFSKRK